MASLLESIESDSTTLVDLSAAIVSDLKSIETLPLSSDAMIRVNETVHALKSKQLKSGKLLEELDTNLSLLQSAVGEEPAREISSRADGELQTSLYK